MCHLDPSKNLQNPEVCDVNSWIKGSTRQNRRGVPTVGDTIQMCVCVYIYIYVCENGINGMRVGQVSQHLFTLSEDPLNWINCFGWFALHCFFVP